MAALIGRGLGASVARPDARDAKSSGEGSETFAAYATPGGRVSIQQRRERLRAATHWLATAGVFDPKGLHIGRPGEFAADLIAQELELKDLTKAMASTRAALDGLLTHYVGLVNSGDAGRWDPETEDEVIAARAALQIPLPFGSERSDEGNPATAEPMSEPDQ